MASSSIAFDVIARDLASSNLRQVGSAAGRTSGPLSKMGGRLKGLTLAAGAAAGAAVVFAAKWGVEAVKAAAADAEAQALLAGQLKRSTDARKSDIKGVEAWVAAQGEALGVADDDLRPALARLVTATEDVSEAQKLAGLAMDVSAAKGKSLQSVSEALGRAADGNTQSLSRLGVQTKDAKGKTLSFTEITKQLAETFGGAASEKADTLAGKMQRLKVRYDETKEAIGARLLPMLDRLATWLLDEGIPAAEDLERELNAGLVPAMQELSKATRQFRKDAAPLSDLLGDITGSSEDMGLAMMVARAQMIVTKNTLFALGKALGYLGNQARFIWNNIWQPVFKFMAKSVANLMGVWASMLRALGKVPGFEWADKAADKMGKAAAAANRMANSIRDIPDRKNVLVTVVTTHQGTYGINDPALPRRVPHMATGGIVTKPTLALIGEKGPEAVVPLTGRHRGMGGDIHATFNITGGDPRRNAEEIRRMLLKLKRDMGGAELGLA